jgi:hypothetical protein
MTNGPSPEEQRQIDDLRAYMDTLSPEHRAAVKEGLKIYLHKTNPVSWCRAAGVECDDWQAEIMDRAITAPGSRILCLLSRQSGKSTIGALRAAYAMATNPGSLSMIVSPSMKQSSELILKIRKYLIATGHTLLHDNQMSLSLKNGSRVIGLPGQSGSDAGMRGYSISNGGVLIFDEAARVSDALWLAAKPTLIRYYNSATVLLLSTAWAQNGFFWDIYNGKPDPWLVIERNIYDCPHISDEVREAERLSVDEATWNREYLNRFNSLHESCFSWDQIDACFPGGIATSTPEATDGEPDPVVKSDQPFSFSNTSRSEARF